MKNSAISAEENASARRTLGQTGKAIAYAWAALQAAVPLDVLKDYVGGCFTGCAKLEEFSYGEEGKGFNKRQGSAAAMNCPGLAGVDANDGKENVKQLHGCYDRRDELGSCGDHHQQIRSAGHTHQFQNSDLPRRLDKLVVGAPGAPTINSIL